MISARTGVQSNDLTISILSGYPVRIFIPTIDLIGVKKSYITRIDTYNQRKVSLVYIKPVQNIDFLFEILKLLLYISIYQLVHSEIEGCHSV
jgi:hypothetical protein